VPAEGKMQGSESEYNFLPTVGFSRKLRYLITDFNYVLVPEPKPIDFCQSCKQKLMRLPPRFAQAAVFHKFLTLTETIMDEILASKNSTKTMRVINI
jgi:hypothetical protein